MINFITFLFRNNSISKRAKHKNGKLSQCPTQANCFLSGSLEVPSIKYHHSMSSQQVMDNLVNVIASYPRAKVIEKNHIYLWCEFRTILGFIDDVEFLIENSEIQYRSISRLGYYDFGKNKSRYFKVKKMILSALDT